MELKRGKTFIKSGLHGSHDRPLGRAGAAPTREEGEPWSTSTGGQQRSSGERCPKLGSGTQGPDRGSHRGTPLDSEGGAPFRSVRKSKTQDNVRGAGRAAPAEGQLVGSASFPGPSGGQRMIDYRHFVPQMPFVPAVAKSIPKKRISLKRPKKCFRNLFLPRRSKTERLAALAGGAGPRSSQGGVEVGAQLDAAFLPWGDGLGLDGQAQELPDPELLQEASFSLCRALCEDVASLQSFDSLTGCGEIFADESSAPTLELPQGPPSPTRAPRGPEGKAPGDPCQGGAEQLASPVQSEPCGPARFWGDVSQARPPAPEPRVDRPPEPRLRGAEGLNELPLLAGRAPPGGSKASSADTGTPKSEQPESVSTSDEGYYDSFSPGLDDDRREAASLGPGGPPRDSYSGDALYELFRAPGQGPAPPGLDAEPCATESLSGPPPGPPLSLCSFHGGAEETLAAAPGPELPGQGFLQSSWRGKECLLKLCDTELAITMGIVNWLRRGPGDTLSAASAPRQGSPEAGGPEPWGRPGARGLPAGDAEALGGAPWGPGPLPRGPSLGSTQVSGDTGTRDGPQGSFCSLGAPAASETTGAASKGQVAALPVWPSPPGHFQNPWTPGPGGGGLQAEPPLPAQLAALQIRSPAEELCGRPRTRGPELLRQKRSSGFPSVAAMCGLPSVARPLHGPQDQRCPGHLLSLSRLRVEGGQLDAPGQDVPVWLSPPAREQLAQLDS